MRWWLPPTENTPTTEDAPIDYEKQPLADLVGCVGKSEQFGWTVISLLAAAIVIPVAVTTAVAFFFVAWLFAGLLWPPYTTVIDLIFTVILVTTFLPRYRRVGNRAEAFLFGAEISFQRLVVIRVFLASVALIVFISGCLLVKGWHTDTPFEMSVTYWWHECIALLLCAWAVVELLRHSQDLRLLRAHFQNTTRGFSWESPASSIAAQEEAFQIAHLTDLHLTRPKDPRVKSPKYGIDSPTVSKEKKNGIWISFRQLLTSHVEAIDQCDALIVTGDLTDTAHVAEWNGFFDAFEGFERWLTKLVILPGNHDVNLCSVFGEDNADMIQRKRNLIRFLAAVDKVQGDRTVILSEDGNVPFRDWASQFTVRFKTFLESDMRRIYRPSTTFIDGVSTVTSQEDVTPQSTLDLIRLPDTTWNDAFPMLVSVPNKKPKFLILDTNMPGSNIFTNAFGYLNEQQLARLKKFLTVSTTEPLILGLHHHLGNPVVALKGKVRVLDRGLTLCNADALLRALPDARSYVAFNGHRHIHYTGLIDGRVTVISGESTTLGNSVETNEAKENTDPSIARYKLSWLPSGDFEGFERLPELSLKK